MARQRFVRGILDKQKETLSALRAELDAVNNKIRNRRQLFSELASGQFRSTREMIDKEISAAKEALSRLDFEDEEDLQKARHLTAEMRVLRIFCMEDEFNQEIVALEERRNQVVQRIEEIVKVRRA